MMVAAISNTASTTDPQNPKITPPQDEHSRRTPLLPSEKDNNNGVSKNQRKPKSKIVNSRYMMSPSSSTSPSNSSSSSASSRRFPSPLISRNSTPASNAPSLGLKRAVSADRGRPAVARPLITDLESKHCNANEVSAATKLLVTSTRRLSVSFQGEAFTLPISKTKVTPPSPNLSNVRKGTPERRRSGTPVRGKVDGGGDQVENARPSDQHRWPARNRLVNPLSGGLNCNCGEKNGIISLQQAMIDERRPSLDGRSSLGFGLRSNSELINGNSVNHNELLMPSDLTTSDSDSVSSGSTSEVQECDRGSNGLNGPRGIAGSARFWKETNSRLRRMIDPGSPQSPGSKLIVPPKLKRYSSDGPLSSLGTMSSPIRGGIGQASPSKVMTPPSRAYSPARIRNAVSTISNSFVETPSVLSFAVDIRRGKIGENRIVDAHLLRLLYNRHLQWRFVNARSEGVMLVQEHSVEMMFLEDWASLDKDHSISLLGAIEALKASTLRLPVGGGAMAEVRSLKDAIGSSFDVMQALTSSIFSLLPTIEEVNTLVTELAKVTTKEQALLEQCTDFVSMLAAMQVKDSSLRTHIIQHNR
ncbi:hypothetical protein BUALT_Bualt19G0104300 [Buddleja alternifolia]|uniref:QWRF motif-containing protein 2 n=1 Tax=Buddleja alternifolia TaxID=168488 RepID=A0AAV6W727_9LAMI|nr:hypothetical protein BUALT_Bualt19G0104300 [Buddleja alternifolia]